MRRRTAIKLRILIRVTTSDYPYKSICYVGAYRFGGPILNGIEAKAPVLLPLTKNCLGIKIQ